MKKFVLMLSALLVTSQAGAQTPSPNASDRISSTIGHLVIESENKTDVIVALQTQAEAMKKQIADLEEKLKAMTAPVEEKKNAE